MIWRYDKTIPDYSPRHININRAAVENSLYDIKGLEPSDINVFENALAKIERKCAPILKRILSSEKFLIENNERKYIANLVAAQLVRTPQFINSVKVTGSILLNQFSINQALNKNKWHSDYKIHNKNISDEEIEEDRMSVLNNEFEFDFTDNAKFTYITRLTNSISKNIMWFRWLILKTNHDLPFIISDNFMNIYNPGNQTTTIFDIMKKYDTRVIFPLSINITFLMINNIDFKDGNFYNVSNHNKIKELVKSNNKATYLLANKYIFSRTNTENQIKYFKNIQSILRAIDSI